MVPSPLKDFDEEGKDQFTASAKLNKGSGH